jgi:ATP-dependent helicase HrpB
MNGQLPIHDVLHELIRAVHAEQRVVLCAPPGAGKTTVVPLALLADGGFEGKIIMLEPRRLAARAAAERMATTLSEMVGQTIGYRVRGNTKTSNTTKIEVVTEGILTRMIQSDPELRGISCIIFDEFHERSLNGDLGLALSLEIRDALRDDLRIVVMSATLDADPISKLMSDAPVVTSEGRSFPVTPIWLPRPAPAKQRLEIGINELIHQALAQTDGSVLVFLPGEREIRNVMRVLSVDLTQGVTIHPLFGALDFKEQQLAIAPPTKGRKVVLATSIAETSLTIEGITAVVDSGLARRALYDAGTGMSRLITTKASKAEATQRMGRAGRLSAGTCFKYWSRAEEGQLPKFAPAEIERADLATFALDLAQWGTNEHDLALLTQPNAATLEDARAVLKMLGALDETGRITDHGRTLSRVPAHPRIAHMITTAGENATLPAALLGERDILQKSGQSDFTKRIQAIVDDESNVPKSTRNRIKSEAKRLNRFTAQNGPRYSVAQMLTLAFPDRIGARRVGKAPRFILSGGKGAIMRDEDALASERYIVAIELDGDPREAQIRLALPITEGEIRDLFHDQIHWQSVCEWSKRDGRVVARKREYFGTVILNDQIWKDVGDAELATAMLDGVRELGLTLTPSTARFLARVRLAADDFPGFDEGTLLQELDDWLFPFLTGVTTSEAWRTFDITPALKSRLNWDQQSKLDRLAPSHFTTPLGRKIPIDYDGEHPQIALRLQEMFGQVTHPQVVGKPLRVTLLSPAGRPVQTTLDIPGFWATSYTDVRKDMRGRYPKHPWPEDPTQADPTLRAKPRGT